jgi:hypothetical protein
LSWHYPVSSPRIILEKAESIFSHGIQFADGKNLYTLGFNRHAIQQLISMVLEFIADASR